MIVRNMDDEVIFVLFLKENIPSGAAIGIISDVKSAKTW